MLLLNMPYGRLNWELTGQARPAKPPLLHAELRRLPTIANETAAAFPAVLTMPAVEQTTAAHPGKNGLGLDAASLYYYLPTEVDERPRLKQMLSLPEQPAGSHLAVTGKVTLEILIERDGETNAVNVMDSSLPPIYVDSAVAIIVKASYVPAIREHIQVRARRYVEVSYVDGVLNMPPAEMVDISRRQEEHSTWGPIPRPQRNAR